MAGAADPAQTGNPLDAAVRGICQHTGRVILQVDESLRALLLAAVPDDATVGIEPDGSDVVATLTDLREDTTGLPANWEDLRDDRGVVVARRPPIRRYELRYTVTAHAKSAAAEHALLDAMLAGISAVSTIDAPYRHADFAEYPLLIRIADTRPTLTDRPLCLDVIVTAPMLLAWASEVAPAPDEFTLDAGRDVSGPAPPDSRPPRPMRARRAREGG